MSRLIPTLMSYDINRGYICQAFRPTQVVEELLKYLVVADYSMREEIVLKTAVLAEKLPPQPRVVRGQHADADRARRRVRQQGRLVRSGAVSLLERVSHLLLHLLLAMPASADMRRKALHLCNRLVVRALQTARIEPQCCRGHHQVTMPRTVSVARSGAACRK